MGTRDQKLTPRSRTQHPTRSQNRHWAAEDAKVRGGAAKDTTGDHCSDAILYPLRYRQPMEYITHVGSDGKKLGQPPNKTGSRTQNSVQPSQGTKRKPNQSALSNGQNKLFHCPTPGTRGRSSLRSMDQGLGYSLLFLLVPPQAMPAHSHSRWLAGLGPSVWNGLRLAQRLLHKILSDTFYSSLKTFL